MVPVAYTYSSRQTAVSMQWNTAQHQFYGMCSTPVCFLIWDADQFCHALSWRNIKWAQARWSQQQSYYSNVRCYEHVRHKWHTSISQPNRFHPLKNHKIHHWFDTQSTAAQKRDFTQKTNNEVRTISHQIPPHSTIHLGNRDRSRVMHGGLEAWDWGFLWHNA